MKTEVALTQERKGLKKSLKSDQDLNLINPDISLAN